ncbi:MAG TPA: fibrobacter succinogenes major paralogous domain-containing protein [Chitinophagaceae bacterium]
MFGSAIQAQPNTETKNYKSVKIGDQVWMTENLDLTTYRNGDTIPQVQDPKAWSELKTGAWCYYESKTEFGTRYGKLYNWYAVTDQRGLAPQGWHIPSDEEWTKLTIYLGGKIGTSLKIKSQRGWAKEGNGSNETGFAALPGGTRSVELFSFVGNYGYWWTSTEFDPYSAWNRFLGYNNTDIGRSTGWKQFGNSVRCIKGEVENIVSKSTQAALIETKNEKLISSTDSLKNVSVANEINVPTIAVGEQVWMVQNLDVSTFQNGDPIPEAKSDSEWIRAGKLKQPAWCYYKNDSLNEKKFGKLYNWYAVIDKRGLAPTGWHIPAEKEWTKLVNELGGEKNIGPRIKSLTGWKVNDTAKNVNETGFRGLPAGFRSASGEFYNIGLGAYWWSASESLPVSAWYNSVTYFSDDFKSEGSGDKQKGYSVRCIKD